MAVIGITGGISTGKTSFCECLREIVPAAKFFDADQVAHQLVDLDPGVKRNSSRIWRGNFLGHRGLESRQTSRHSIRRRGKKARPRTDSSSADSPPMEHGSGNASQLSRFFLR